MSIDKIIDETRTAMLSAREQARDKREWASYWDGVHYGYQSMLTPLEELKAELEALRDTSFGHAPVTPPLAASETDEEKRIIFTYLPVSGFFGCPYTLMQEGDLPPAEPGRCRHRIMTRAGDYMYCHSCGAKLMYE